MSDKLELVIGGKVIRDFTSYRVESDLFAAADAWSVELADPDITVAAGSRCQLKVNGILELNGIIDRVTRSYDKSGRRLSLEGRDLMGLVVDTYCTQYPGLAGMKLSTLAQRLLAGVPFVGGVRIIYGQGDKSRAVEVTKKEEEYQYTQIRPGQTVFDALKAKALESGRIFFCLPDGTLVFGQPATSGRAHFAFTTLKDGRQNNIISASLTDDISRRYKSVTIMGQKQGDDDTEPGGQNVLATVHDPEFPFPKSYVATLEDGQDPHNYARMLMDGMRFEGWQLEIKVPGHSQNGRNFTTNAICHVRDEILGLNRDLLCHGRVFERSKEGGTTTTLRLSRLGVQPA